MLKVAVTLAVLLVAVLAQSPPTATQQCVQVVNSTSIAFCSTYWTYAYVNNTDLVAANNNAQSQYNANVARVTNPSASCQAALATYYCQSALPRCSRYSSQSSVYVTRCNNVNTQCNVTGFPTAPFTGNACINNQILSVDGPEFLCVNPTVVALGAACTSGTALFNPATTVTAPYTINGCPIVSSCNFTATNPTCVRPNNLGDACTSTCTSQTGGVGSVLTCIAGTCQYTGKRFQAPCANNAECLSQNCTSGQCFESPLGGACLSSVNCRQGLYCDTFNQTCYAVATAGQLCGIVQPGQTQVPCDNGLTCTVSGNFSRCVANAVTGAACSYATAGTVVYGSPLCAIGNTCRSNICVQGLGLQQIGQACNVTTPCDYSLTCSYPAGAAITASGVCAQPNTVACDLIGQTCNTFQRCNCGTSPSAQGTCSIDTSNPLASCAAQAASLGQCLNTNCGGVSSAFYPFDSFSCASRNCLTQQNVYFCCAQTVAGANFVAPTGFVSSVCATLSPTPTPGPTGNGTTTAGPTSSGVPTPTGNTTTTAAPRRSSRSNAGTIAISFVAMILAVVAFL